MYSRVVRSDENVPVARPEVQQGRIDQSRDCFHRASFRHASERRRRPGSPGRAQQASYAKEMALPFRGQVIAPIQRAGQRVVAPGAARFPEHRKAIVECLVEIYESGCRQMPRCELERERYAVEFAADRRSCGKMLARSFEPRPSQFGARQEERNCIFHRSKGSIRTTASPSERSGTRLVRMIAVRRSAATSAAISGSKSAINPSALSSSKSDGGIETASAMALAVAVLARSSVASAARAEGSSP